MNVPTISRAWRNLRFPFSGICPILLSSFLFLAAAGNAQSPAENSIEAEGIRITLSLNPTRIRVGEPVYLTISATNISARRAEGAVTLRPYLAEGNDLDAYVQRPGELEARYEGALDPGSYPAQEFTLLPQQSTRHNILLLYDRSQPSGYLFGQPGNYKVRARASASVFRNETLTIVELPPRDGGSNRR